MRESFTTGAQQIRADPISWVKEATTEGQIRAREPVWRELQVGATGGAERDAQLVAVRAAPWERGEEPI